MRYFKTLTVVFMLVSITGCTAQKKNPLKIYAYSRPVLPGTIAVERNDGEQKEITQTKQNRDYYIYAELLQHSAITVTGLWIDSIFYTVSTGHVTGTPVTIPSFKPAGESPVIILVPQTGNNVITIIPEEKDKQVSLPSKFDSSQLVIRYTINNKEKFTAVKKIKELEPEIRQ